jgi:hypothetical protein
MQLRRRFNTRKSMHPIEAMVVPCAQAEAIDAELRAVFRTRV